jgi:primosomal protein N' (replication factor Y)
VISADTSLAIPDFRAAERTFQLLSQVAGRAGRGETAGRVVVQTSSPEHGAIRAAAEHDYVGFAKMEMAMREELAYPPFTRIVRLLVQGKDEGKVARAAREVAARIGDRHRHHCVVKVHRPRGVAKVTAAAEAALGPRRKSAELIVDVDAQSLL